MIIMKNNKNTRIGGQPDDRSARPARNKEMISYHFFDGVLDCLCGRRCVFTDSNSLDHVLHY